MTIITTTKREINNKEPWYKQPYCWDNQQLESLQDSNEKEVHPIKNELSALLSDMTEQTHQTFSEFDTGWTKGQL